MEYTYAWHRHKNMLYVLKGLKRLNFHEWIQNMSSDRVCASSVLMVCMWDAKECMTTHGEKCVKHTTNDQNMINMNNYGYPQNLVLIGVQNSEKMSFGHFIKHLECTHYTCMLNNARTYEKLV